MKTLLLTMLLSGCAVTGHYAYTGMGAAECNAQCASYGLSPIGVVAGECQCDPRTCKRSRNHGGCEQLQPAAGVTLPTTSQM